MPYLLPPFIGIIFQPNMLCFKADVADEQLLRVYALKHCYDESRVFEKSKGQHPHLQQVAGNCILIRKGRVKNQSQFGYKEELKTSILRKMFFVYLESVEDLLAFLWKHCQEKEHHFGLIMVENVEQYFGEVFDYRECGPSFLIFTKLLKMITAKLGIKGRVCFTYLFRHSLFKKAEFEEFLRSEDITDWEIMRGEVLKNGQRYESDMTKTFMTQYSAPLEFKPKETH